MAIFAMLIMTGSTGTKNPPYAEAPLRGIFAHPDFTQVKMKKYDII